MHYLVQQEDALLAVRKGIRVELQNISQAAERSGLCHKQLVCMEPEEAALEKAALSLLKCKSIPFICKDHRDLFS